MRENKVVAKKPKRHSLADRAALREVKRKTGGSAVRRRERRAHLQQPAKQQISDAEHDDRTLDEMV